MNKNIPEDFELNVNFGEGGNYRMAWIPIQTTTIIVYRRYYFRLKIRRTAKLNRPDREHKTMISILNFIKQIAELFGKYSTVLFDSKVSPQQRFLTASFDSEVSPQQRFLTASKQAQPVDLRIVNYLIQFNWKQFCHVHIFFT